MRAQVRLGVARREVGHLVANRADAPCTSPYLPYICLYLPTLPLRAPRPGLAERGGEAGRDLGRDPGRELGREAGREPEPSAPSSVSSLGRLRWDEDA